MKVMPEPVQSLLSTAGIRSREETVFHQPGKIRRPGLATVKVSYDIRPLTRSHMTSCTTLFFWGLEHTKFYIAWMNPIFPWIPHEVPGFSHGSPDTGFRREKSSGVLQAYLYHRISFKVEWEGEAWWGWQSLSPNTLHSAEYWNCFSKERTYTSILTLF